MRPTGRASVAATTSGGGPRRASLAGAALRGTEGETSSQQSLPFSADLLVQTISNENKEALEWSNEGHEDQQDDVDHIDSRQNGVQEGKEPRQAHRDEDGHENAELLRTFPLLGLRSLRQGTVDLRCDEEEQDRVDAHKDETRQEERGEDVYGLTDITSAIDKASQPVLSVSTNDKNRNTRNAPAHQVVILLELTSAGITLHNHLVEVEGDASTPQEIAEEEIVDNCAEKDTGR